MVALAEERDDSDTGVTANDSDVLVLGVGSLDLRDEAAGADNIQSGDTEKGLGVVDTAGLEDLGADRNGRVDGVRNDEELGIGSRLSNSLGEIADNGGVGVEEIVTGHAGLTGDTSGDEDDVGALDALGEASSGGLITLDGRLGVDMRKVGSDTCRAVTLARQVLFHNCREERRWVAQGN